MIRRNDAEEKTTGGIIIPESGKADGGVVVAAGSGARDEQRQIVALHVKSGDHILFGKWVGHRGEAR